MKHVALITGASGGIGSSTSQVLAAQGFQIAVHYHQGEDRAHQLCKTLSKQGYVAKPFAADITDQQQVFQMVSQIAEEMGDIDLLVNNAGIAQQKLFSDISEEDWDTMFAVNVKGMFHCIQAVLPRMIHYKRGKIINLSSIWGMVGASCEVHYSAAKAAIIGMTKALAKEVGPSGIQVNCVAPGVIDTPMNAQLDATVLDALVEETPLERLGTPLDVAHMIAYLASPQADFITGQVFSPNGGFVIV